MQVRKSHRKLRGVNLLEEGFGSQPCHGGGQQLQNTSLRSGQCAQICALPRDHTLASSWRCNLQILIIFSLTAPPGTLRMAAHWGVKACCAPLGGNICSACVARKVCQ